MNTLILVLSLIAGIVGTGVGGILGVLLKNKGNKVMSRILSFAGGVMVGIVVFEMIPESIAKTRFEKNPYGVFITFAAVVCGILLTFGLNKILDRLENVRETHRSLEELHHETQVLQLTQNQTEESTNKTALVKAGLIMLLAIMFHNIPEGMAIGATGTAEVKMGVLVAILIAVHNVPEGMAISAPLASGGMKAWKTILLTSLAGAATVVGAIIGMAIGGIGTLAIGICMGIAGGAMLYVTFCEIIPQSILMDEGRIPAVSMLIGILCAMLFVYLF
ncbi:MAG: ZIP family metal transporter [Anaeroplasmataceae bacterium]|nr:ZIP family metal transporter [Anaeroplasmataceae bacterium]MDE7385370.1 ZIP family metal transporter [Anaeroplasmataceae bacterium]